MHQILLASMMEQEKVVEEKKGDGDGDHHGW